jgi:cellobiose phosphorylase
MTASSSPGSAPARTATAPAPRPTSRLSPPARVDLGIRPELTGLVVDPVLPADWPGFQATRVFRGATYEITVRKPAGATGRVAYLIVDGERVDGTVVPPAAPGAVIRVEAVIEG